MAKISVIVPVYKVEQYLNRCVDSILNQTYKDFELILVDDGSPDNCPKICDEYALKDSRVKVIHKQNGGQSEARNVGVDYAFTTDSEWITFIDSDDYVPNTSLFDLYCLVKEANVDVSIGKFNIVVDNNVEPCINNFEKFVVSPSELTIDREKKFDKICIDYPWAKLFKKSLFQNIRFPNMPIFEDSFIMYKIVFQCNTIAITNRIVYNYYQNDDGITHSAWNLERCNNILIVKEQIEFFQKNNFEIDVINVTIKKLLFVYAGNIHIIKKLNDLQYSNFLKKLKKELKAYLKQYKRTLQLFGKEYDNLYFAAYPFEMRVWFHIRKILIKLKLYK